MRYQICEIPQYRLQQDALDEIGKDLGVVVYRPNYHAADGDHNTVMFYTKEDDEYNRSLEKSGMDRVGGFDRTKPGFFYFENTDANGNESFDFANYGNIDLRGVGWKKALRGAIETYYYVKLQEDYVRSCGGYGNIREADETYNNFNRKIIESFAAKNLKAYLGNINFDGKRRKNVASGNISVYDEYHEGQHICNFDYSFIVPTPDENLQKMIRSWNSDNKLPKEKASVEEITRRVSLLKGINLIWF